MDNADWYRKRYYLHFDMPLSITLAQKTVVHPVRIKQHSFYPFISYKIITKKICNSKSNNKFEYKEKEREISYASHIDACIYSYYASILNEQYEKRLSKLNIGESITAFRSLGKSNIEFASQAFNKIRSQGECGVAALDVTGFFDNIDHKLLKNKWANLLGLDSLPNDHYAVYKSITQYSKVNRNDLYKTLNISKHNPKNGRFRVCNAKQLRDIVKGDGLIQTNRTGKGIPQGSPISALLSNIFMLDFDVWAVDHANKHGGSYYRYCDDMLFIVPPDMLNIIAKRVRDKLKELKLDLNTGKTELRKFTITPERKLTSDLPLQYLGFIFDGQRTTIRSAAFAKYTERMKSAVRLAKSTKRKHNKIRHASGQKRQKLYRKKLYTRYSHLGQRNFLRYGYRAAEIMNSIAIKKQLKPLWKRLILEIEK